MTLLPSVCRPHCHVLRPRPQAAALFRSSELDQGLLLGSSLVLSTLSMVYGFFALSYSIACQNSSFRERDVGRAPVFAALLVHVSWALASVGSCIGALPGALAWIGPASLLLVGMLQVSVAWEGRDGPFVSPECD